MSEASLHIAEQAAQWILALDDGDARQQAQTRRDFENWQQADPRHADAAQKAQAFIGKLEGLRGASHSARKALDARFSQRRQQRRNIAGTTLGLVLLLLLPALLVLQQYPLAYLTADLQTRAGQWQSHTLEDGSKITLAGKSAVDIQFNNGVRELRLLSGEIYVDVAKDPQRPFVVSSEFGHIQALGTRFVVNHHPDTHTRLTMLESRVQVSTGKPDEQPLVVKQGEQLILSRAGLGHIEPVNADMQESRWHKRQLIIRGWPLAEVLEELSRHHRGLLLFDPESLPDISVSAVLPLDEPEQALQLLASSFPAMRVRGLSSWVVLVDRAE